MQKYDAFGDQGKVGLAVRSLSTHKTIPHAFGNPMGLKRITEEGGKKREEMVYGIFVPVGNALYDYAVSGAGIERFTVKHGDSNLRDYWHHETIDGQILAVNPSLEVLQNATSVAVAPLILAQSGVSFKSNIIKRDGKYVKSTETVIYFKPHIPGYNGFISIGSTGNNSASMLKVINDVAVIAGKAKDTEGNSAPKQVYEISVRLSLGDPVEKFAQITQDQLDNTPAGEKIERKSSLLRLIQFSVIDTKPEDVSELLPPVYEHAMAFIDQATCVTTFKKDAEGNLSLESIKVKGGIADRDGVVIVGNQTDWTVKLPGDDTVFIHEGLVDGQTGKKDGVPYGLTVFLVHELPKSMIAQLDNELKAWRDYAEKHNGEPLVVAFKGVFKRSPLNGKITGMYVANIGVIGVYTPPVK
jgi:hypothetical protein